MAKSSQKRTKKLFLSKPKKRRSKILTLSKMMAFKLAIKISIQTNCPDIHPAKPIIAMEEITHNNRRWTFSLDCSKPTGSPVNFGKDHMDLISPWVKLDRNMRIPIGLPDPSGYHRGFLENHLTEIFKIKREVPGPYPFNLEQSKRSQRLGGTLTNSQMDPRYS